MSEERSITAAELARRLKGRLHGDGDLAVGRVAPLDEAGSDALSWVASPESLKQAPHSEAGIILVPEGHALRPEQTFITVADPDAALCEVLAYLAPPLEKVAEGVDRTATVCAGALVEGAAIGTGVYVGSRAVVGPGTQLHPGVYVGADARIGRECVLWPNVVVRDRVKLGNRVVIHPNSTIGADGFGYLQRDGRHKKIPQIGTVEIGDDVEIGANSAIDRARSGVTRIGRGTKIDNLVQIGHNVDVGEDCIIIGACAIGGSASLGRHVILGGMVAVSDHQRLGDGVQVAAKSGVFSNIPAGAVVRGVPAQEMRKSRRQEASVRRLPKLMERFRELVKRVRKLEGHE